MSLLHSTQLRLVARWRAHADAWRSRPHKPALWRRALAALIDRLAPLPFIAFFWPRWAVVVLLYHLLCEAGAQRRSLGKRICRLRATSRETGQPCAVWQAIGRRVGQAAAQTAWSLWIALPYVLVYELASLVCVLLSPTGQRLEDLLLGTRVMTERAWRRARSSHPDGDSIRQCC